MVDKVRIKINDNDSIEKLEIKIISLEKNTQIDNNDKIRKIKICKYKIKKLYEMIESL
tara:strand:- start:90 stop:263 length:174 start_codon:yes stop_codon:yes gene_type:complete